MEELLFLCPHCGAHITPPEQGNQMHCQNCQRVFDLTGQFAYVRAYQAYEEAAEEMDDLKKFGKRKYDRYAYDLREQHAFNVFLESYSALQEALRYELAEKQLEHAIQMASNLATIFVPRQWISELEAAYWSTLRLEQTARKEYEALGERLNGEGGKRLGIFRRWRLVMRQDQLFRSLAEIDKKIRRIEQGMGLAYRIQPYRGKRIS